MSYILFSQTSGANGTRDLWNVKTGAGGTMVGNTSAHGALAEIAASDFSVESLGLLPLLARANGAGDDANYADGRAFDRGQWGLYDLSGPSFAATGLSQAAGGSDSLAGLGVLGNGNAAQSLGAGSGFANGVLTVGLAEGNWNRIKNVEVRLDSADTAGALGGSGLYSGLRLANFVDARVKIGDTDFSGCTDAKAFASAGRFALDVVNGKRGQVDGSASDMALDVRIDVWTNDGGWQNSFGNTGSVFGDTFAIGYGALSSANMFGRGAGATYTGKAAVDAPGRPGDVARGDSVYNGQLTTLLTQMGAGDDRYDATDGALVVACGKGINADAVLMTRDLVWGGSGDDLIRAGGNDDALFGDWGFLGGIGAASDPTAAPSLRIGGTGDARAWVDGTGVALTAFNGGNGATTVFSAADLGDAAKRAVFDTAFYLDARGAGVSASEIRLNGGAPFDAAYGIGVDTTSAAEVNNGSANNNEINSGPTDGDGGTGAGAAEPGPHDTLTLDLGREASALKGTLSLFYGRELATTVAGTGAAQTATFGAETAVVRLGRDADGDGVLDAGEVVGTVRFSAVSTDDAVGTSGIVTGFTGQARALDGSAVLAQAYALDNPGLFDFAITTNGAFDLVEFSSGGYVSVTVPRNGATFAPVATAGAERDSASGVVSDFLLRDLCFTLAALEGDDTLEAGTGRDTLVGGGDTGRVTARVEAGAELLANGGFEALAADAAQQEGGAWYLTAGASAGAGAAFGWSTPTGSSIEIQNGTTGGLAAYAGARKLEIDSHPSSAADSMPSQAVATVAGGAYTLAFAFAERQGAGDGSSDFRVFWDGEAVATFANPKGADAWTVSKVASGVRVEIADVGAKGGWFTATVTGLVGDGADAVAFRGLAGQTNTHGAFLDEVSLKAGFATLTVEGGDRLHLGGADGARDTVVFEAGDGFDLVYGYQAAGTKAANRDVIDLVGLSVASDEVAVVNGDLGLLLAFTDGDAATLDDGRMFVAGVTRLSDLILV